MVQTGVRFPSGPFRRSILSACSCCCIMIAPSSISRQHIGEHDHGEGQQRKEEERQEAEEDCGQEVSGLRGSSNFQVPAFKQAMQA